MRKATRTDAAIRSRARTGMAVFCVALINLTLQPCAMAIEALADVDQPQLSEHCIEHGHAIPQHEQISAEDCSQSGEFLTDARAVQKDGKRSMDAGQAVAFIGPCVPRLPSYSPSLLPPEKAFTAHAGSIPLPVLLCRYLK